MQDGFSYKGVLSPPQARLKLFYLPPSKRL